jgi:pectate lyase-like protein
MLCSRQRFLLSVVFVLILSAVHSPATVTTINVQNYGALGNGVADDTIAIDRAIAALPSSGGILYFPCGVYPISSSLTPIRTSNTTVTGPSTNCVTLKAIGINSMTMMEVGGAGLTQLHIPLIADTTSNTFTVASGGLATAGIKVGSYVLVSDQATPTHGPLSPLISDQEVVKVIGISGDTATIEHTFSTQFTIAAGSYVQRIIAPVMADTISYLAFDGSSNTGSSTMALKLTYAVSSRAMYVSARQFLGTSVSGGILLDTGYLNHLHDAVCSSCGNGGGASNNSITLRRQSYAALTRITINNTAAQSVFSFVVNDTHFSSFSDIFVDAGGAIGRPFKTLRASHNVFTNVTAKHGGGGHNGFSITDVSTYNTFTNCVALNNSGKGIAMFGYYNHHNTFNNCTAKYNQDGQFVQAPDVTGAYHDHYTTINGGTFCCARQPNATIAVIHSDHSSLKGASITDDLGEAINGLTVSGSYAVIENNQFSGFPLAHDIVVSSGLSTSTYSGNTTPDGTTPPGIP